MLRNLEISHWEGHTRLLSRREECGGLVVLGSNTLQCGCVLEKQCVEDGWTSNWLVVVIRRVSSVGEEVMRASFKSVSKDR